MYLLANLSLSGFSAPEKDPFGRVFIQTIKFLIREIHASALKNVVEGKRRERRKFLNS